MRKVKREEKGERGVYECLFMYCGGECDQRGVNDRNAVLCRARGKCDRTTTPETSLGWLLAGWLAKGWTDRIHSVEVQRAIRVSVGREENNRFLAHGHTHLKSGTTGASN